MAYIKLEDLNEGFDIDFDLKPIEKPVEET